MDKKIHTKKKYYLLFAAYFLAFGIAVAFLTSLINYNIKYTDIEKQLSVRAKSEADFKRDYLKSYISRLEMTLLSITKNDLTKKYVTTKSNIDKKNLSNLFYSLAYSNKDLMQLRFIASDGMEEIRVDRDKKSPDLMILNQNQMQNKGDRYYFKEAVQINNNTFWHSNVDLNIEHGEIEKPLKPTFRIATPLILLNKTQGIVIANVIMDNLLDVLGNSHNFHIYIIDKDGEIITNPEEDKSWSRYLDNKPNIHDIFPDKARKILSSHTLIENDLFMYSYAGMFRNNEGLKLLMVPKDDVVGKLKMNNIFTALLIAFIVFSVSIPLSWVASFIPSRLQNEVVDAYNEIKRYANIIDKNIVTSKTDPEGNLLEVSTKFQEVSGYSKKEIEGKSHNILRHPQTSVEHYQELWGSIKRGHIWSGEMQNLGKNGKSYWIRQIITPEFDKKGNITAFTSIAEDITDRKIIECMSITDRLTKLYNRHKLDTALEEEVTRFKRYKKPFCAVIIDADHFKVVNDTHGHQVGDDVLIKLANIIKESTRESDFAGRWGGEEFLILSIETTDQNALILAEKLRKTVENADFTPVDKVTVSIGIAEFRENETIANFINRADKALYEAKQSGRNKVVIYKD